jgi:hypothetical protein
VTGPFGYIRLLGDRAEVDRLTPTLDHTVIDRTDQIYADAQAIQRISERVPVLAFVNNHFAGYAHDTVQKLLEAFIFSLKRSERMKLWLLQVNDAQEPWFDRMFGFVVRAKDEAGARRLASSRAGDEGPEGWLSPAHSTCVELKADGTEEVIMEDYNPAKLCSPPPKYAGPKGAQATGRLTRAKS